MAGAFATGAAASADPFEECVLAARDASRVSGVPLPVLLAVTMTETGRGPDARPWPWTVNMEGEGRWFDSRGEAQAFAEARRAAGAESFDVGCFQINWRWHHEAFVSIEQMFDPLANATYAAAFLKDLFAETGDWSLAAGAFHSRTPEHAARYRATFDRHYAAAEGHAEGEWASQDAPSPETRVAQSDPSEARTNTFPLLRASAGPSRLGSLVPLGG